ncbi:MAG: ATP-binding protein [Burkholderiales bacterium]|nr:ATP-binding protein [Burkholderiales bacterium]
MLPRAAAPTLRRLARHYPVVALTGPRQSGKTTLARAAFPRKPYANLEELDAREFAERDPRGFLGQFPAGAIVDEAQRAPGLFSYLQGEVDRERRPGRYILTGSQQFGLFSGITQSLAGRVGILHLLPFTLAELGRGHRPAGLEELLWRGLYPPVIEPGLPPANWYANYVATYVERDVRQLVNVRDLAPFRRFVRMCAARTGQLLNLSSLAADCGVTHNTAKAWLSVLEASYLVHLLPPYHRNFGKRLVKTPKLYFADAGLAAALAEVRTARELAVHPMRGALFETWVVAELLKARLNAGRTPDLYFWRDSNGVEVDVVHQRAGRLRALEIKAGRTVASDWFGPLERLARVTPAAGAVIYGGDAGQPRRENPVFGWREIDAAERRLSG